MRHRPHLSRRSMMLAALALGGAARTARAQAPVEADPWPSLSGQIFDDHPVGDGGRVLSLEAPYRAEDAATVPITLHNLLAPDAAQRIQQITLVIDGNPSPLAARFSPGPQSGIRTLSTRVRIDSYTNIHAVAAMGDGSLLATTSFIKAAGGCSAPAAKQETSEIPIGTMRFRQFPQEQPDGLKQAQLMIRHPNYSGMQMDQLTRLYVPAHFVSSVQVWQGGDLLLALESGISISENPEYRFDYRPNGAADFHAEVHDSRGQVFKQSWPAARA